MPDPLHWGREYAVSSAIASYNCPRLLCANLRLCAVCTVIFSFFKNKTKLKYYCEFLLFTTYWFWRTSIHFSTTTNNDFCGYRRLPASVAKLLPILNWNHRTHFYLNAQFNPVISLLWIWNKMGENVWRSTHREHTLSSNDLTQIAENFR